MKSGRINARGRKNKKEECIFLMIVSLSFRLITSINEVSADSILQKSNLGSLVCLLVTIKETSISLISSDMCIETCKSCSDLASKFMLSFTLYPFSVISGAFHRSRQKQYKTWEFGDEVGGEQNPIADT